jgi:dTDP-4-dehydrorhamnose 3,5-epimerase
MQTLTTMLQGPVLLAPVVHGDERGFFVETFRRAALRELGHDLDFVQDNHSRSRRGVVRGMHFQPGQAKLVRCARGAILDVIVDVRRGSPQFGEWEAVRLDDVEHRQLFVPDGFAHGFCVLSELADVTYKVTTYYDPSIESGFSYTDPAVGIEWPDADSLVGSERDRTAPTLAEREPDLPYTYA